MIPLLIIILLFFAFFDGRFSSIQKILVLIFCLVSWWFLESFRWESGTDFYNYYNNFNGLLVKDIPTDRFELGYNLLVIFCRDYLKCSFYVFNSIYYFVIFLLYFFSIKKATQTPILFLFVFFCFAIGLMGSSRQLMALSIMFFATIYFLEKQKLWFILSIIIASFVHRTIVVCFIFIFFTINIKYKYWLYIIVFGFIIQISGFNTFIIGKTISFLPKGFSERFFAYLPIANENNMSLKVFFFGILRRILPIILFFLYKEKLIVLAKNKIEYISNILFCSLFAYILLSFEFSFIISRISIYFNIFEALFYVWLISVFIKEKKYVYVGGLVLFFLVLCIKSIMYYPQLFLPYKTIFFTL